MSGEARAIEKTMEAPTPGNEATDGDAAVRQIMEQMEQDDELILLPLDGRSRGPLHAAA
jgi:hypothetical protein